MSKTYTERICYRHGIVKPENKVLELHAFCDCDKCKIRRKSVNHGLRNVLTVTVEKMERLNEAKQFIDTWECKKNEYDFRAEYEKAVSTYINHSKRDISLIDEEDLKTILEAEKSVENVQENAFEDTYNTSNKSNDESEESKEISE